MRNSQGIAISTLLRDPILAEIFRRAERDGLAGAAIDRPKLPKADGGVARVRELESA